MNLPQLRPPQLIPLRRDGTPFEHMRFLVDEFGVYGLSIDPVEDYFPPDAVTIISRPDKVIDAGFDVPTLFQGLPRREAPWDRGHESWMADRLLRHWLHERGMSHSGPWEAIVEIAFRTNSAVPVEPEDE